MSKDWLPRPDTIREAQAAIERSDDSVKNDQLYMIDNMPSKSEMVLQNNRNKAELERLLPLSEHIDEGNLKDKDISGMSMPTARKDHICDTCQKTISKGTKYIRRYENGAGMAINKKEHVICEDHEDRYTVGVTIGGE